ncbi:hypothetical protein [uncultured Friedmanniella sp.]|uniref:hypothetical protein n=1 Tax=uncultured Friedmanniella sp. TaxID=335381 RepID=UPI0035CA47C4
MVTKPARKGDETKTDPTTSGDAAVVVEEAAVVDTAVEDGFTGRWFPVAVEDGSTVLSDNPDDRGRTLTVAESRGWLGAEPVPGEQEWQHPAAEDGSAPTLTVKPKDGKITLSIEQFELLAAGAGLTKVDPVA